MKDRKKTARKVSASAPVRRKAGKADNDPLQSISYFEISPDPILILTPDTKIAKINQAFAEFFGYAPEEAIGRSVFDFVPESEYVKLKCEMESTIKTGGIRHFDTIALTKKGEQIPVSPYGRAIKDEDGNVICLIASVRDISERKLAEKKIAHMHELMQYVISHAQSAIAVHDRDMKYIYVSDQYLKQYHVKEEDVIGKHHYDVFPDLPQKWRDVHQRVLAGAVEGKDEDPYVRADGSTDWTRWECRPWYERDGSIGGLIVYTEVITERVRREAALRESEERYRRLFETSVSPILVIDANGNYLDCNSAAEKFLESTRDEILKKNVGDYIPPGKKDQVLDTHAPLWESGGVVETEYYINGGVKTMELSINRSVWKGAPVAFAIGIDITGRKRAEEALWQSRNMLDRVLNTMPQSVFWKDRNSVYLGCNNVFAKAAGLETAEQIAGKTDFDLPWREAAEAYRADDREVITANRPKYHIAEPLQQADGTRLWIDTSKVPLTDRDGRVFGLLGVYEDITERRRTETALKESEGRLRALIDAIPDAVIFKDAAGRHLIVNKANEALFGLTPEMMIGKTVEDLMPPELAASCRTNDELVLSSRRPVHLEERSTDKNGKEQIIDTRKFPLYDDSGATAGLVAIIRDITDRKHDEEKIRQNEQFIRNILDTVDEGFIVIDRDFKILTANKAFCDQAGLHCDEVIGRHCHEISHATSRPCYDEGEDCSVRHVFATGEPHAALHKHLDHDGRVMYVETKAFPVKDASGKVTSAIQTVNNITERHLLEEERLKTQKLESIGMLAGGIAHDFNNLLQGIFGYISMAKLTHDQKEKSLAMLEQAEKALHQSVNLTTQLLTFSKGGKPVRTRMTLLPMIENAARFALSGSRSECRIDCDPGLWQVDADEGQLGQVIQNIVLNADQAMPLGGRIEITARNIPASDARRPKSLGGQNHVLITIKDTGIGISEQFLSKIFDPYFTTKEKGSGLGLATSYSIVNNHDGLIEVQSEVGKGTTFLIYLPATGETAAEPMKEAAPLAGKTGRILVMDDELVVREVAGELLRTLGHEVEFAEHGEAALALYREARTSNRPFDIVILDLTIRGGMGGLETVAKLLEADPGAKAVVSSGYSDDSSLSRYRALGFKAFLKKPYHIEELQHTLNSLLG